MASNSDPLNEPHWGGDQLGADLNIRNEDGTVNLKQTYRVLIALGVPFEEVTPKRWQRALGIAPRGRTETKVQWKSRLKDFAQRRFPDIKVTLATADALLLALYCQRVFAQPGAPA